MADKRYIEPNNMYYQVRIEKGLSRDKACNLFERISPDRLERIENGKVMPNPEEIMEIAERYCEPEIRNYYCANQCPMGKHFVREVRQHDFSRAVLQVLAGANRLNQCKERIIEIASEGSVKEEDYEDYAAIVAELEQISSSIDSLLLWHEKAVANNTIDGERIDEYKKASKDK